LDKSTVTITVARDRLFKLASFVYLFGIEKTRNLENRLLFSLKVFLSPIQRLAKSELE
jgi:hypothetical protein